jgi:hypothetical protein
LLRLCVAFNASLPLIRQSPVQLQSVLLCSKSNILKLFSLVFQTTDKTGKNKILLALPGTQCTSSDYCVTF